MAEGITMKFGGSTIHGNVIRYTQKFGTCFWLNDVIVNNIISKSMFVVFIRNVPGNPGKV